MQKQLILAEVVPHPDTKAVAPVLGLEEANDTTRLVVEPVAKADDGRRTAISKSSVLELYDP